MKLYNKPDRDTWEGICSRPEENFDKIDRIVENVFNGVESEGDKELKRFSKEFDGIDMDQFQIDLSKLDVPDPDESLKEAIDVAYRNIWRFHEAQRRTEKPLETSRGVSCWRKDVAIQKVGLYVPGGTAPLFSTILMLAIPARIAGCSEIVLCTPPGKEQLVHPSIVYTCRKLGIDSIYLVGGAQAVAAMSIGTETVPKVNKIFGPGNSFVTRAKMKAAEYKVAIDMPAGPSELLVIADKNSNPAWVAADLLSQAEHGNDSQVVLLSDDRKLIDDVQYELDKQLIELPRRAFAESALSNSFCVLLTSLNDCIEFSNIYAPEHLIIVPELEEGQLEEIINAGSVFLGAYSCESAGDYISGTNHTLPTNAYARMYSGVSYDSFVKRITFQNISKEGLVGVGAYIEIMAEAEGLHAHRNAVSIRLKELRNE